MAYTTINDPSAYFQTKLYTGGTAEAKTFDGNSNLKPDLFWSKKRGAVQNHFLADSVRGTTYAISSNTTAASYTDSETDDLASFDTNGFTFSGIGDTYNGTYQSDSYVAWGWSAAGNSGSANTAGDLNSTVSVNTTAGFSIVTYSGTGNFGESVGHGLGVAPSMIIARRLNGVEDWGVYHKALGASKYIILNTTGAEQSSTSRWGGVAPTNSVFTVGNHASVNVGSGTHVAYCFAEKQGYSKFGNYTGNGSADGTFVYTGFKPAFVMVKGSSFASAWTMTDNRRDSKNVINGQLFANNNNAEDTSTSNSMCDYLSNGFKMRSTGAAMNSSNNAYIYMAFAEAPLVGDNPATAR